MILLNPEYTLFFLLPFIVFFLFLMGDRSRKALMRDMKRQKAYAGRALKGPLLILLGLILAVFALMRPVSHPEEQIIKQEGRNIVFLVDVSRSMLAEDLVPNRLDRARFDIQAAIPLLRGNRVALVAFAGDSILKCPLTTDYAFFNQAVDELSVYSVTRGGSCMGDAIRTVINDLFPEEKSFMDIILITDGEDQETFPLEAAYKARDKGIRLIAIGMGNTENPTAIPDDSDTGEEYLIYQEKVVFSSPDMEGLQEIAAASQKGWAVSVPRGSINIAEILDRLDGESQETGSYSHINYSEYYQWILLPAFLLIFSAVYMRKRFAL
ncbi:MAG: hypothetical protein B6241_03940 [Spirochaetaceae bacterium 4572_59]|nr:MAG: hypothetical protein B6241_03940 [Spirochaetaceae bacterium 4572_59]